MTVTVRWEQCCDTPGCGRPARLGDLCVGCWMAATPARRRVELDWQCARDEAATSARECEGLRAVFDLPAVEPRRAA